MAKINQETIMVASAELFASDGMINFSIRSVAKKLQIAPSLIYYYFKNEDELLLSMFHYLNRELGRKRAALPLAPDAGTRLRRQLEFQIEHQATIVAVLKYYLKFRPTFPKFKDGFLPDKSALHIEEILQYGQETGEFVTTDIQGDAKFITHAINGYLLEYYPHQPTPTEKKSLVDQMYSFIMRGLTKQGL